MESEISELESESKGRADAVKRQYRKMQVQFRHVKDLERKFRTLGLSHTQEVSTCNRERVFNMCTCNRKCVCIHVSIHNFSCPVEKLVECIMRTVYNVHYTSAMEQAL